MPDEVTRVPAAVLLVNVLVTLLTLVLVVRVILGNVRAMMGRERLGPFFGRVDDYVTDVTEPILVPVRRILPDVGLPFDFSPLVAIIVVDLIGRLLTFALLRAM